MQEKFLNNPPDKTEATSSSSRNTAGAFQPIRLEDHVVKFVTESECLGMTVDNRLSGVHKLKMYHLTLTKR